MKPKRWVYPVGADRLAWCKAQMEQYQELGNLEISPLAAGQEFGTHLRLLRINHLAREELISAPLFRASANFVAREMIRRYIRHSIPCTPIGLFPWRASLVFLRDFMSLANASPKNVYHLGASRDEKTLRTKIYFEEPAPLLVENKFRRREIVHCYIMDPMLATGNTIITAIEHLKKYRARKNQITDAMITVISLFAAPEGVARLINQYPSLRIITAALDDHLDKHGFITPGCGDFGDQYFAGLKAENFKEFYIYDWISSRVWPAFVERMNRRQR